jgi:uncharacterized membrane protein YphA (DoxX/SURF4 family)
MSNLTRAALVVLRLAIGWHFLFEGLDKLETWFAGPREGRPVWSSAGYLRASTGPLAPVFRSLADDPDAQALERLTLPEVKAGEAPKLPPALEKDWQDYFDRFVEHYKVGSVTVVQPEYVALLGPGMSGAFPAAVSWAGVWQATRDAAPDKIQLILARSDLDHAKATALTWLLQGDIEVPTRLVKSDEKVKVKASKRIADYRAALARVRVIETEGLPAMDRDVWKSRLVDLKREVNITRAELLAAVNRPMKDAMKFVHDKRLNAQQRNREALPDPPRPARMLDWIDLTTMWGLTLVGACLLLGLFTRTACVAGAGFLLMFYLSMPALWWLPESPRAEGHYLIINKNLIELFALLLLATTQSGKWVGLDGLLQFLRREKRSNLPREPVKMGQKPEAVPR